MLKLFRVNEEVYVILHNNKQIEGNIQFVFIKMIEIGVSSWEIMNGFDALEKDDVAEYGINKTFIFSQKLYKQTA